jgi:hypothetical protein
LVVEEEEEVGVDAFPKETIIAKVGLEIRAADTSNGGEMDESQSPLG